MTTAALVFGAVAALGGSGTVAAVAFGAGAVWAAGQGSLPATAAFAGAATCAFLSMARLPSRLLAMPALGLASLLVAGSSSNAAAVLPAWILATSSVTFSRGPGYRPGWTVVAVLSDLPFAAGLAWAISQEGFVSWQDPLPSASALAFCATALLKAVAAAGGSQTDPGFAVIARVQALVALLLASNGAPPTAAFLLIGGALAFGGSGFLSNRARMDSVQEAGLVALVLGGWLSGRHPTALVWVAVAAGTLLHLLSATSEAPAPADAPALRDRLLGRQSLLAAMASGPGAGSVIWMAAAAVALAAVRAGGIEGGLVVAALAAGIAGRGRARISDRPRHHSGQGPWVTVAEAVAVLLGLLGLATAARAGAATWSEAVRPGLLAVPAAVVLSAFVAGPVWKWAFGEDPTAATTVHDLPASEAFAVAPSERWSRFNAFLDAAAGRRGLVVAVLALLATAAMGVWVTGYLRGFL